MTRLGDEAVDAALFLRSHFALATGSRLNVHADPMASFDGETAILQVLERTSWPANQARRVRSGLLVISDSFSIGQLEQVSLR